MKGDNENDVINKIHMGGAITPLIPETSLKNEIKRLKNAATINCHKSHRG